MMGMYNEFDTKRQREKAAAPPHVYVVVDRFIGVNYSL